MTTRRSLLPALFGAVLIGNGGCVIPIVDFGGFGRTAALEETELEGRGDAKLVLIEIEGVLGFDESGVSDFLRFSREPSVIARLHEALELAEADDDVVALILRIRSPGGGVAASETLHHLVSSWKARTGRPVVAYLQGLAASGGYYVAMASDEVVAHPSAVTGSIGVIMPGVNFAELMEKVGVADQSITSGAFKSTGTMLRKMRDDERAQLQSVVDDLHGRFVEVVDAGRPQLTTERIRELADGRIYTARQAADAGLVDRMGHMEVAIERARTLAGVPQATLVTYHAAGRLARNRYSRFWSESEQPAPAARAEASVFPDPASALPAGFYYLWPEVLRR